MNVDPKSDAIVDGRRQVQADRWVYAQLQRIIRVASESDRDELNEIAKTHFQELDQQLSASINVSSTLPMNKGFDKDEQQLAALVAGLSGTKYADTMQADWIDQLDGEKTPLMVEQALLRMRQSSSIKQQAKATLRLAKLYANHNRPDLVSRLVDELKSDYADVALDDGSAGNLAGQLLEDSELKDELKEIADVWSDELQVKAFTVQGRRFNYAKHFIPVESSTGQLWPFEGWAFRWSSSLRKLIAIDAAGRTRWSTDFGIRSLYIDYRSARIITVGHLILLETSSQLYCVDGLENGKLLWKIPKTNTARTSGFGITGSNLRITAASPNGLLVTTPSALQLLDPFTGRMLWTTSNSGVSGRAILNDRFAWVSTANGLGATRIDLLDGSVQKTGQTNGIALGDRVPSNPHLAQLQQVMKMVGRGTAEVATKKLVGVTGTQLVAVDSNEEKTKVESFDVFSENVVWSKDLNSKAKVSSVVNGFVAILADDRLRIVDASTGVDVASVEVSKPQTREM